MNSFNKRSTDKPNIIAKIFAKVKHPEIIMIIGGAIILFTGVIILIASSIAG